MRPRLIATLLVNKGRLVKTVKFDKMTYIGDPINAVRIFNDKEADELVILDISATRGGGPRYDLMERIAGEAARKRAHPPRSIQLASTARLSSARRISAGNPPMRSAHFSASR